MRVLFLGGGTGGHLAAGIAVANVLTGRGDQVLFAIAGRRVEHDLLEPRGLPSIALFGDRPRPSLAALRPWLVAAGRWRAVVRDYDPDVLVVLGGWVAAPALVAGWLGRPSVLVEQNARPGKVARRLDRRVDHVCLAHEAPGMPRGRRSTRWTGHPSSELPRLERGEAARRLGLASDRRTLLLMGGSQGAADLNALRPGLCSVLEATGDEWQVLHLTGTGTRAVGADDASVGGASGGDASEGGVPVQARPFLADMAAAYSLADVAVCRAGAGTLAELTLTGTPSVLVPYPHHADRHQEANGAPLVAQGAALMVGRDDPTGRRTASALLRAALDRLPAMSVAARRLARPDAARAVADVVRRAAAAAQARQAGPELEGVAR